MSSEVFDDLGGLRRDDDLPASYDEVKHRSCIDCGAGVKEWCTFVNTFGVRIRRRHPCVLRFNSSPEEGTA